MATKTYPLWRPGNPQLRIFLPDFFMKLVKPKKNLPPHIVKFEVHIKMSDIDVKNYLTQIYKVPVKDVQTSVQQGLTIRNALGNEIREPDKRIAFVVLDKNATFSFPNLFPAAAQKDMEREEAQYGNQINQMKLRRLKHWDRAGGPTWFAF